MRLCSLTFVAVNLVTFGCDANDEDHCGDQHVTWDKREREHLLCHGMNGWVVSGGGVTDGLAIT